MSKTLISIAALAAFTVAAHAQSPAPTEPAPSPPGATEPTPPAPGAATPVPSDSAKAAGDTHSGSGDTANQETYKMKSGGMYQPPAKRPASPAQDLSIYGRT